MCENTILQIPLLKFTGPTVRLGRSGDQNNLNLATQC